MFVQFIIYVYFLWGALKYDFLSSVSSRTEKLYILNFQPREAELFEEAALSVVDW